MLLAPFARTAKLVLERIELFVMDAILAVPCTLTPPALKAMDESLMKAWPAFVLPARLTPSGEMPDRAADDIDLLEGGNAHAIKARPKSLDVALVAAIAITPLLYFMLAKNGASLNYTALLTILVLIGLAIQLDVGVLGVIPRLCADIGVIHASISSAPSCD
jgi:hypothetical protein